MTQQQLIVNHRKNLLIFAERHGITQACSTFGVSRTTYYKLKKQLLETGTLTPKIPRRPRMPNEITLSKKKLILRLVQKYPSYGPARYAYELRKDGIYISRHCVWRHLKRFDLNRVYKRLIYLETFKNENKPLTEKNLRLMKYQLHKVKQGLWPGNIVGIDTFYVGNLKGVGRIYQMTGIDLCSRFGWADLFLSKDQDASIKFTEETLIPRFFNNRVPIESVLSDNGSEFTGKRFQQMLDDYDIKHHRIPKGKPMFNGCCERFQRTIYDEFYKKQFRTRFFNTIDELREALNNYLVFYNFERAHFGLVKTGALPVDILKSQDYVLRHRFQKLLT
jgi:transposase InsO family protein